MQKGVRRNAKLISDRIEELVILLIVTLPKANHFLPIVTWCTFNSHISVVFAYHLLAVHTSELTKCLRAIVDDVEVDKRGIHFPQIL